MNQFSGRRMKWASLGGALLLVAGLVTASGCAKKKNAAGQAGAASGAAGGNSGPGGSSDKTGAGALAGNESSLDEQGRVRERSSRKPDTTGEALVDDIHFDFDNAGLTSESRQALDEVAKILKERAGWRVVLEGHCDERGAEEYNLALGQRRASAAKSYLKGHGIAGKLLDAVSLGEAYPADPAHSEEAWAKNRRVHVVFHKSPATSSRQ